MILILCHFAGVFKHWAVGNNGFTLEIIKVIENIQESPLVKVN